MIRTVAGFGLLSPKKVTFIVSSLFCSEERDHTHNESKEDQHVEHLWLVPRWRSLRSHTFWAGLEFNRHLDLRYRAGFEAPLRIGLKSRAIEQVIAGALQHARTRNLAGGFIDRE